MPVCLDSRSALSTIAIVNNMPAAANPPVTEDAVRRIIAEELSKVTSSAEGGNTKASLSVNLPGGGSSAPLDEGTIVSALYRQFGLVLGEIQAGDEASAVARIRANLRALSVVRDRPDGWSQHGQTVDSYTKNGKTEADPLTPCGNVGGLDVNMLSAEHASVLYPGSARGPQ